MGNTNTVPLISQTKSLVQFVTGDKDGARDTQEKFLHECPIVAQATSIVELVADKNREKFKDTNLRTVKVLSNVADGIPIVGHVKGAIHAAAGDFPGARNAIKSANRSVGVVGGGVVGFLTLGPIGAVAGGIAGGAALDGIQTGVESAVYREFRPNGSIAAVRRVVIHPSGGTVFDAIALPIFDGLGGFSAGQLTAQIQSGIASAVPPPDPSTTSSSAAGHGTTVATDGGASSSATSSAASASQPATAAAPETQPSAAAPSSGTAGAPSTHSTAAATAPSTQGSSVAPSSSSASSTGGSATASASSSTSATTHGSTSTASATPAASSTSATAAPASSTTGTTSTASAAPTTSSSVTPAASSTSAATAPVSSTTGTAGSTASSSGSAASGGTTVSSTTGTPSAASSASSSGAVSSAAPAPAVQPPTAPSAPTSGSVSASSSTTTGAAGSQSVSASASSTASTAPTASTTGTATSASSSGATGGGVTAPSTTGTSSAAPSVQSSATTSSGAVPSSATAPAASQSASASTAASTQSTVTTASSSAAPAASSHGAATTSATTTTQTSAAGSGSATAPASSHAGVATNTTTAQSGTAATSTSSSGVPAATAAPSTTTTPAAATGGNHSIIHHRPGSVIIADMKHLAADVRHALQQLDGLHVQHPISSDIVQSTLDPSGQIAVHIPDILQPLLPVLKWTTVSTNVQQLQLIYDQLKVVYDLVDSFDATPEKYPKQIDIAAPDHSLAFKMILHEILRFIGPSQSRRHKILEKTEKLRDRVYSLVHSKDCDQDLSSLFEKREHTLHCVHWNMAGISAPLLEHLGLVWYLVLDSPDVLLLSQVEASDYLITGLTRILGYKFLKFPSSSIIDDPLPGSALLFRPRDNFVCTGAGSEGEITVMESFEFVWADFINLQTSKHFRLASLQYADAPAQTVTDTMAAISADQSTIFACSSVSSISVDIQEAGFQLASTVSASSANSTSSLKRFSNSLSQSMRRRKKFEQIDDGIMTISGDSRHVRCHFPQNRMGRKRSPADPLHLPIPFSVGENVNPSRLPCTSKDCFYGCS